MSDTTTGPVRMEGSCEVLSQVKTAEEEGPLVGVPSSSRHNNFDGPQRDFKRHTSLDLSFQTAHYDTKISS